MQMPYLKGLGVIKLERCKLVIFILCLSVSPLMVGVRLHHWDCFRFELQKHLKVLFQN